MKNIVVTAVSTIVIFASLSVQAADTTELKVTGTIRPPACTPSFGGSNVADFGTIPAKSLKAGQYTALPPKALAFSVTCYSPTRFALITVDNKISSVIMNSDVENLVGTKFGDHLYGLGFAPGNQKIGTYSLQVSGLTGDGAPVVDIWSNNSGTSWNLAYPHLANQLSNTYHSFAATGTMTPAAFKTVSMNITVKAALNKPEELPLNQDIPLDGSTTIEVRYL